MNENDVIPAQAGIRFHALVAPIAAAILGAIVIYLAGFAPLEALHDGAHDARHSAAFPCH